MRQINLLPRELAAKRRSRQLLGAVIAGGVAMLGILIIVYITQQARLTNAKNKLEDQNTKNARLRTQVAQLSQFSQGQNELADKTALLSALSKTEVVWSKILTEVSLVIPTDDWLTSFTGTSLVAAQTTVGQPTGSVTVAGCTLIPPDGAHLNVANFLVQISKPLVFTNSPFLTLSSKADTGECPVTFNAQLTLAPPATRTAQGQERKI